MRNLVLTAIAFFMLTGFVQAQHMNIGIKGGLNFSTIHTDVDSDFNSKVGFVVGLLSHIHITENFALQPEVVYSTQGAAYKFTGIDYKLNLNYINIPVNFQYMFDNGFRLQAGPQIGFLTSAKAVSSGSDLDMKSNFENIDFGLTFGMSYVKPSTGFGIDLRYNLGFTNINANDVVNSYNRVLQLSLFYLFQHSS
jgi:hypothetical protein